MRNPTKLIVAVLTAGGICVGQVYAEARDDKAPVKKKPVAGEAEINITGVLKAVIKARRNKKTKKLRKYRRYYLLPEKGKAMRLLFKLKEGDEKPHLAELVKKKVSIKGTGRKYYVGRQAYLKITKLEEFGEAREENEEEEDIELDEKTE